MKYIPLTKGKFAIVDDEDFEAANQFRWYAQASRYKDQPPVFYAARRLRKGRLILLHRWLLGVFSDEIEVDHKNFDTLDCRRRNLRKVTSQQNSFHLRKIRRKCSSRFKGVCHVPKVNSRNPWIAYINCSGRRSYLGYFSNEQVAAKAYNVAARSLFGQFAVLNNI